MKDKKVSIISIAIVFIFLLAIVNLIVGITTDYNRGNRTTANSFDHLTSQTSSILTRIPTNSPDFLASFVNAASTTANIAYVRLENNNNVLYQFPANQSEQISSSSLIKTFTTQLDSPDGYLQLTVSLFIISPADIFNRIRTAFMLILFATLLTAILLLYVYLSEKKSPAIINDLQEDFDDDIDENDIFNPSTTIDDGNDFIEEDDITAEPLKTETIEETPLEPIETTTIEIPESEQIQEEVLSQEKIEEDNLEENTTIETTTEEIEPSQDVFEENQDINEIQEEKVPTFEVETVESDEEMPLEPVETPVSEEKTNTALFSEITGLCQESYLKTRLESELIRAASAEQDLTFFVIRIPNIDFAASYVKEIVSKLKEYFSFADMIFEYGTDSFAAIKTNETLDPALDLSESLHSDLITILRNNGNNETPLIGISARSLRLLSAERLITEATQAANHAESDELSPIVAFRVNPDRYRKFLAENGTN